MCAAHMSLKSLNCKQLHTQVVVKALAEALYHAVIWNTTNLCEFAVANVMLKSLECIWIPCNKCLPMDALHPCLRLALHVKRT